MGKKNRRKGDDDFEKDFEIQDSDQPQEQVEAQPTAGRPLGMPGTPGRTGLQECFE